MPLSSLKRHIIFTCGLICVVLGAIGVVLPILPTTPFLLLAAACFAKTSQRFHSWLLGNPYFGPLIKNWQTERFIEKKAKTRALLLIVATFSLSIYMVGMVYLKIMLVCMMVGSLVCVGRLPTVPLSQRK